MTSLNSSLRLLVVLLATVGLSIIGCGGDSTSAAGAGGTAGTGGTSGTGGAEPVTIALPECSLEGYEALWGELWTGVQLLLGYVDATVDPPSPFDTRAWNPPPMSILPPIEDLSDPTKKKPRVVWKTFCWGSWRADFYQRLEETFYGVSPTFYLNNGFFNSTVAVVDWRGISDENALPGCNFNNDADQDASFFAKGTFSIAGLDNDVVRVTLIKFPECAPLPQEQPLRVDDPKLCADPEDPNDPYYDPGYNDNPWWDDGTGCRFELTSLGMQVNISSTTPRDPTGVIIGFTATIPGHTIENGSIIFGTDGVVSFTGTYDGQPASFDFDPDAEELTITFPGAPETRCDVDTTTGIELVDCE